MIHDIILHSTALRRWRSVALVLALLVVAYAAQGGTLYLADASNLYEIDLATSAMTFVGPAACDGLALSATPGALLYGTSSGTGPYEGVGFLHTLFYPGGIVQHAVQVQGDADRGLAYNLADGLLYGTDNYVFGTINPATGQVTPLTSPPTEPESLAADPGRGLIYGVDRGGVLLAYNIVSNTWDAIGPASVDGGKGGLAYEPAADLLYYVDTDGKFYSIDPLDGSSTPLPSINGVEDSVGLTYVPVMPEPDVKVDGSDGPLGVRRRRPVSVTLSIDAGDLDDAIECETWIHANTPFGWYYYDVGSGQWLPGQGMSSQGTLEDMPSTLILEGALPAGPYTLQCNIDLMVNGVQDVGYSDSVELTVW